MLTFMDISHYCAMEIKQDDIYLFYHYLKEAKVYYPNFDIWYYANVVPSINNGTKQIIIISENNIIKGISIVKLQDEKKLCTLKVMDNYQNKGIGIKLFEKSFEVLKTTKPLLSVSEEKLPVFKKIFNYYGFKLTSIKDSYYRKNKKEYFYNEID
ncbi:MULTISPECIES: GNAT family N-acetyltransferase [Campylobacter]|uniref:GNAT family N-acetyltransferase n=1 Tax=Campylobacter molothri TaxID=1032242 RepID=UPI001E1141E9|nr:GNAT family N-acetyltransferase [Campylobacter sp. RM10542]MBZ7946821.1 GNAT family N-acetyltransferase [Campylobacter sp. RM10536]MBZ7957194.1 GNAT family N-acetyltransferase [Campylobacter sp. RM10541]